MWVYRTTGCGAGTEKPFWLICITHLLLEVYLLVQVALIPVYVSEFQLSLLEASLVATIPSLVTLLMNVPIGFLVDRFNAKHLLFASMMIEGVSAIFLSQTDSFWALVLGVSVLRISSPVYHITGLSHIALIVKQERVSRSIGIHNALGSLGVAVGAVSLAFFMTSFGWRSTYLFWAIPVLSWGLVLLRMPHFETKTYEQSVPERKAGLGRVSYVLTLSFAVFLVGIGLREIGISGVSTFMTTYLVKVRGLSEVMSSLIFGLGPLTGIIGALSGGLLGERIGAKRALNLATSGCAISLFALSLTSQLYTLSIIYLTYAFFSHSVWTPMNTLVSEMAPRSERGLSFSVYMFTEGLMQSVGPVVAAAVIERSSIPFVFPFGIAFTLASLVTLQFFSPRGTSHRTIFIQP